MKCMLRWFKVLGILMVMLLAACEQRWPIGASGGGAPNLILPFASGKYWQMTQGFDGMEGGIGSHKDWGFRYGDDSFAIDFSQSACTAYGQPVYPMLSGTVLQVTHEEDDDGYGNSILVDHGNGFVSRYAHLSELEVTSTNVAVDPSRPIGRVGNTGFVSGRACPDHPGTHLHIAFYKDGEAAPPFPLSGLSAMRVGCWYNREGDEQCTGGQPDDYTPVDDHWNGQEHSQAGDAEDDTDELVDDSPPVDPESYGVSMLELSPTWGSEDGTVFIWSTVVTTQNPTHEPDVVLSLTNSADAHTYGFPMETESVRSPWIFTYSKTLRDAAEYDYWVDVDADGDLYGSRTETIEVFTDGPTWLYFNQFNEDPHFANVGETLTFEAEFESDTWPELSLVIINPNDGALYRFEMDVDVNWGSGSIDHYVGSFEKSMRDATSYLYWVEADNGLDTQTSSVETLIVE